MKIIVKRMIIILLIVSLGWGGYYFYSRFAVAQTSKSQTSQTTVMVKRGDLAVNISGTGTVEPIARYDIVPLVKGNIIKSPFEEGMSVKKGDLLYEFDSTDLTISIEKTRNSIAKFELNNQITLDSISKLVLTAPFDGRVINFSAAKGDPIGNNGKIADIVVDDVLIVKLPFNAAQAKHIQPGQEARVLVEEYLQYLDARVKSISDSRVASEDGSIFYYAEIEIKNPGALVVGTTVRGSIKTPAGEMTSIAEGTLEYARKQSIISETSGIVKEVFVKDNEIVKEGQKILELENETLLLDQDKSYYEALDLQLSLESQLRQLNDYRILSPIDGVIIKKNAKAGDTLNTASNDDVLMTIADLSKMVFTMAIDELDIAKIKLGQDVKVQADALPNRTFEGRVTNIAAEGVSQNGVTTFDVEVTIDEPGELKSGMNVNADIFIEQKENVLYLPISAIQKVQGNYFVFVPDESSEQITENRKETTDQQEAPSGNTNNRRQQLSDQSNSSARRTTMNVAGRKMKKVEVGINNEEYIEIISGLNEGEKVTVPDTPSQSNNNRPAGFGGMGGPGGMPRIR